MVQDSKSKEIGNIADVNLRHNCKVAKQSWQSFLFLNNATATLLLPQSIGASVVKFFASIKAIWITFAIVFTLFLPSQASCSIHEISEVFIDSSGNNKYEAKIKANQQGMTRALLLIADSMGIKNTDIADVPYLRLKKVFKPIMILNELSTVDRYNATVTYQYDKASLYQLLIDYGNSNINDMFYEYLVLPVYKQRNFLNIWDKEKRWNDIWASNRPLLNKHKLIYPTKSLVAKKRITPETVFHLTYDDYIEIFPNFMFKKVLVISTEYFTNRKTGEGLMRVDSYLVTHKSNEDKKLESEYPITSPENATQNVQSVIDKVVTEYGKLRKNPEILPQADDQTEEKEKLPIVMNFEVFNQQDMDLIISKISKIDQIDRYVIEHDYDTKYRILIYTEASELELAEGLYLNGLSYKIHGNLYNLIDIKKSGS